MIIAGVRTRPLVLNADGWSIRVLDQRLLPWSVEWADIASLETAALAIEEKSAFASAEKDQVRHTLARLARPRGRRQPVAIGKRRWARPRFLHADLLRHPKGHRPLRARRCSKP